MSDESPKNPLDLPAVPMVPFGAPVPPPGAPVPPPGGAVPPPGAPVPPPGGAVPPPGAPVPPPGASMRPPGVPATVVATGDNSMGVLALIAGILGFTCMPFIGAILAIIFGRIGIKKAEQGLATNGAMARVGFWLGVISLVLSAIGFAIIIILTIVAAIAGGDGTCGIGNNPPCNV